MFSRKEWKKKFFLTLKKVKWTNEHSIKDHQVTWLFWLVYVHYFGMDTVIVAANT